MEVVKRYPLNKHGRDFAVGDVHGYFNRLATALIEVGFDPLVDRLFGVGDLVDRGPESHLVRYHMEQPWFASVTGNHELMLREYAKIPPHKWGRHGTEWFYDVSQKERLEYAKLFKTMPIAIEVETPNGLVGIIHADCMENDWAFTMERLKSPKNNRDFKDMLSTVLWSRQRWMYQGDLPVANIHAMVVGHVCVTEPTRLGNTYYIDTTGGREDRTITLLDLHSLKVYHNKGVACDDATRITEQG